MITTTIPTSSLNTEKTHPSLVAEHLSPEVWTIVNRLLVRKAMSEYAHEVILQPEKIGPGDDKDFSRYRIVSDDEKTEYHFDAQLMALRHWRIPAHSIVKFSNGMESPVDALLFIIEIKGKLAISEEHLPIYLDEISSTLHGAAYKYMHEGLSSVALAHADYQTVETSMAEGHPCFVANNGRLGFDSHDYHAYAPEAAASIQVIWLAAHKEHTQFACIAGMNYDSLLREEIGADMMAHYAGMLREQGLDPHDYYLMPAHPWQWFNKLSIAFASYIAQRKIVCLGYGKDRYRAQQSIRTFFNIECPEKRYVKTSLSILNMGFMRGLSPYYMSGTPAINQFIHKLVQGDPFLRKNGFNILREVATLGFRNHYYEAAVAADTPYKKMLSALWRESPMSQLGPNQRLMTMAALLHVDSHGGALLPELIAASTLSVQEWLERYLDAYLIPLVHCVYEHDLVFMPHGENLILIIENCVPVRVFMKDIAEESWILSKDAEFPDDTRRLLVETTDNFKLLTIFSDVFDGYFRHLSQILVEHQCCTEQDFWRVVAERIISYQKANPRHHEKYQQYDLFAPDMIHSCLNRLQLANNLQMVNLADPISSFLMAPNLLNPIARYKPKFLYSEEALAGERESHVAGRGINESVSDGVRERTSERVSESVDEGINQGISLT